MVARSARLLLTPVVAASILVPARLHAQAAASGHRLYLSADSATRLELTGQLRLRGEYWDDFNFGVATAPAEASDGFALSRLLVGARFDAGSHVSAYLQGKSSLATDRALPGGERTSDVDQIDVQQAWIEGRTTAGRYTVALRIGRTDLALGKERLISPLDWTNSRRTFQGGTISVSGPAGTVTALAVRPVQVRREKPNIGDSTRAVFGGYLAHPFGRSRFGADLYWLYSTSDNAAFNGTSGKEQRHTIGARAYTRSTPTSGGWDADVEAAYQFGTLGAGDIGAAMVGAQLGWSFPRAALAPRVYVGFDFASGDDEASGDVNTFNQLFPLSHAFLGYADVHGRQNVVDVSAGASARLRRATALLDVHRLFRAETDDALYGADGSVAWQAGAGFANSVGTEVDLTLRYPVRERLLLQAGYSHYFAGEFLQQSAATANDLDWVYLQVVLTL